MHYLSSGSIKAFNADVQSAPNPQGYDFPEAGKSDSVVDTKPCSGVSDFLTNSASRLIYQCTPGGAWYEGGKQVYDNQYGLLSFSSNLGLVYSGSVESGVVNLSDGSFTQCGDLSTYVAVRGHGAGFHVAAQATTGLTLFNIKPDGSSTSLGVYPAAASRFPRSSVVLGSDDALYGLSRSTIMRFRPNGASETVATSTSDDYLEWSFLVTGALKRAAVGRPKLVLCADLGREDIRRGRPRPTRNAPRVRVLCRRPPTANRSAAQVRNGPV